MHLGPGQIADGAGRLTHALPRYPSASYGPRVSRCTPLRGSFHAGETALSGSDSRRSSLLRGSAHRVSQGLWANRPRSATGPLHLLARCAESVGYYRHPRRRQLAALPDLPAKPQRLIRGRLGNDDQVRPKLLGRRTRRKVDLRRADLHIAPQVRRCLLSLRTQLPARGASGPQAPRWASRSTA